MDFVRLQSVAFFGLEAVTVDVEVDVKASERFSLLIVGLPDTAVKESKDRVLTAIKNTGYQIKPSQCTVNLAPGDLKKEGPLYDLPIALGLLLAQGSVRSTVQEDYLCAGELSLSGQMRPLRGALSVALLARELGKKGVLLPKENVSEAAAVPGIAVYGVSDLKEAVSFLRDPSALSPFSYDPVERLAKRISPPIDFADIKGQLHVKRSAEIASAGGHNLLLHGPPGSGKTLIAKAMIGILPPLSLDEALEVTKIHSISGLVSGELGLISERPFRAPHHTVSSIALVGGGSTPKPGELSLAHHGVLFLDELPEFSRSTLEVLRQPLENRNVTISRAKGSVQFPTYCILVAAMNPCPCGHFGHPQKPCTDTPAQIQRYRSKISGPLLDRIDMHVAVPAVSFADLHAEQKSEKSIDVQARVIKARTKQAERLGKTRTNALMTNQEVARFCALASPSEMLLKQAMEKLNISARAYHRILKLARTIADLGDKESIEKDHLMEALSFRSQE